jgi:integrase
LLGKILREKSNDEQFDAAIKIVRHLALTACRRGEAIYLKKSEIDVDDSCLRLKDSKEGASVRSIGLPVLDQLTPLIGDEEDGGFVFEGTVEGKPLIGFPRLWKKIFKDAALAGITPHVLRHSFSSIANDLGFTEATIGSLNRTLPEHRHRTIHTYGRHNARNSRRYGGRLHSGLA